MIAFVLLAVFFFWLVGFVSEACGVAVVFVSSPPLVLLIVRSIDTLCEEGLHGVYPPAPPFPLGLRRLVSGGTFISVLLTGAACGGRA